VPADDFSDAPQRLVPLSALLLELPAVRVPAASRRLVRDGRDLGPDAVAEGFPCSAVERVRLVDEEGRLLALAVPRGFGDGPSDLPRVPFLHPEVVLLD